MKNNSVMKNCILTLVTIFVLSISTFAQQGDEKEITAAVEKLRKAMVDGDEKSLNDLTAPELSYGHSSGKIEDQKTFVSRIVKGESDFKTIDITDLTVSVVGNAAIVRHKLVGEVSDNGNISKPNLSVLLVWQKQKGQWRLLARQAVKNL
jgi:ketosteroid isomerase-like protein